MQTGGQRGGQRGGWGEKWGLQEVPKGFSTDTVQQQRGPKIRERDTQLKMVATFKDEDEDSDLSLCLVLSETQIKSWFSSETSQLQKVVVNIEKGFTEISESIDIQDNEELEYSFMIYSLFLDFASFWIKLFCDRTFLPAHVLEIPPKKNHG